ATIAIMARRMEGAELGPQHQIALSAGRQTTLRPRVEPTARHSHTPAENRDLMLGLLRRDEGKPHRLCFAKNAVAFFRMSRSSWRLRFSWRGRPTSPRWGVVRRVRPFDRPACACLPHFPNADATR